jgi:hypothetical protein
MSSKRTTRKAKPRQNERRRGERKRKGQAPQQARCARDVCGCSAGSRSRASPGVSHFRVLKRKTGHPEAGRSNRVSENDRIASVFGSIELACDEFPVPAQDCVRLGDAGHLGQSLAPESAADFGQGAPLRIRQSQERGQMGTQNTRSAAAIPD